MGLQVDGPVVSKDCLDRHNLSSGRERRCSRIRRSGVGIANELSALLDSQGKECDGAGLSLWNGAQALQCRREPANSMRASAVDGQATFPISGEAALQRSAKGVRYQRPATAISPSEGTSG